jgi:hypothetical protein
MNCHYVLHNALSRRNLEIETVIPSREWLDHSRCVRRVSLGPESSRDGSSAKLCASEVSNQKSQDRMKQTPRTLDTLPSRTGNNRQENTPYRRFIACLLWETSNVMRLLTEISGINAWLDRIQEFASLERRSAEATYPGGRRSDFVALYINSRRRL